MPCGASVDATPRGVTSVTVINTLVSVGIPLLASGVAKALDHRYRKRSDGSGKGYKFTPLFWAAFGLYHVFIDYSWLYGHWRNLASHDYTAQFTSSALSSISAAVYVYLAACIASTIGNCAVLACIVRYLDKSTPEADGSMAFKDWRAVNRGVFWTVTLGCVLKLSMFNLLYCRAFGASGLSAPVNLRTAAGTEHRDSRKIQTYQSLMAVAEDLPQLAATLAVNIAVGSYSWAEYHNAAALVMSVVSLLHTVVVALDLACARGSGASDRAGAHPTARAYQALRGSPPRQATHVAVAVREPGASIN